MIQPRTNSGSSFYQNKSNSKAHHPSLLYNQPQTQGAFRKGNEIFLVSSQCLDDQKSLLLQLKGSLRYDSTLSTKLTRWNQSTSECCNWDGVTCDSSSGHVIALELDNESISGGVENSSALFSLQYLEKLNLAYNRFNVGIPAGLDNLTNLKNSWQNLQIIDIASNSFTGVLNAECFSNWRGMMVADDYVETGRNQIQFKFLRLSNLYYQDTVTITIKGLEMELVKILRVFTSIDFSSNRFQGVIPDTVGNLSSLYVLNLSNNALEGPIPKSIGKLQMLGSLDLSSNQLYGEIPSELASLTFLAALNLSFNKLFGRIPSSNQFQTFSAVSFEGNRGLCGFPLNNSCKSDASELTPPPIFQDDSYDWQFIFTGVGYGVGAAISIAHLLFYKRGRKYCDKHLERMLKLMFPRFGFTYTRYDPGKVVAVEHFEDETPDDTEDDDEGEKEASPGCISVTVVQTFYQTPDIQFIPLN
ncbi:hypothetical protein HAX54_009336 [Datura stramonium]|uniref:Leucine-rich repeat-containing N-terminal plant-type domain-containing protein n=1 Tax=Datura stramonium TaxID=4076 RepID=A0ABS8TG17_DATST|nr:hypothetical protein [Datura stramonium]